MPSVQALLAGLQDAARARASVEDFRLRLADLVVLARQDESRQELLTSHALDVLASVVADVVVELSDVLVEVLAALACDRSHATKARIAERPLLLALALRCLQTLAAKKPSKKRTRTMRIALELTETLGATDAAQRENHQGQIVVVLVRVLENPQDDESLLLHATHVLTTSMESRRANIHTAANFNAAAVLLRLLDMPSDRINLKRAVCTALLVIASAPELVSIIASNNAIHSIALCLRLRALNRHVETTALQLLLRLCQESYVYGQVINEGLIPLIFQILARSPTEEVTKATCRVLEGVACFAVGNKLDLSPFINVGLACRGSVLVEAVAYFSHDTTLVASAFRFFGAVMRNPTDLPSLMNGETLEGLLGMHILHCGTIASKAPELGDLLATVVARLDRATIDCVNFESEDQTLPALFLCLRSHLADLQFAGNAFALVTKHWGSKGVAKSAQGLSGFVGIAVELLMLHCGSDEEKSLVQLMDLLYFLRNILLTNDGAEVVLACGGLALSRNLSQRFRKRPGVSTSLDPSASFISLASGDSSVAMHGFEKMALVVVEMVNRAIATAVSHTKMTEGSATKSLSRAAESREENLRYGTSTGSSLHSCSDKLPDDCQSTDSEARNMSEKEMQISDNMFVSNLEQGGSGSDRDSSINAVDDDEVDDEANDDDSDSDGEEEGEQLVHMQRTENGLDEGLLAGHKEEQRHGGKSPPSQSIVAAPRHICFSLSVLCAVNFLKLHDQPFCYVDNDGVRYLKHPTRDQSPEQDPPTTGKKSDGFVLLHEPPTFSEPCRPPDPNSMNAFIDTAMRRREEFVASDPRTRAQIVYENTTVFTDTRMAAMTDGVARHLCTEDYLYDVPDTSTAFKSVSGLTFDSWFESGNLERVIQIGEFEYDLILRCDLNTTGHMQWFYFAVSNIVRPTHASTDRSRYRFNIVNLCKPDSLFNHGLQPVVYSVRDASERHVGWRRAGEDVYYFPNPFPRSHQTCTQTKDGVNKDAGPEGRSTPQSEMGSNTNCATARTSSSTYYTLTFTLDLTNVDDTYLIAHSYPYSFSDHQRHLSRILHQHRPSRRRTPQVIKHSVLCSTIEGRPCDLLTITDFSASAQELKARRVIILTARVHPGEAQASWIMRGAIDLLVGASDAALVLRRLFVFHVVPMLNPDGVFHGNSRCSLSACDLNRHWHNPSPQLHPTIYHIKELVRNEHATRGVVFFCDIHGHSRKKNVFMYGCDTKKRPNPRAQHFAKLLSTQPTTRRFVSFVDCSFKVSKDKENTARVVLTKELKLSWCFTLEASFGGASFGELQDVHFNTAHLRQVGCGLCETLVPACISDVGLRDKIVSLVDNHTVSVASLVENHLREAGIVSDGQVGSISQTAQAITPRKDREMLSKQSTKKEPHAPSKLRRRRTVAVPSEDDHNEATSTLGNKTGRRNTTKRLVSHVSRRKSSPATASQVNVESKIKATETVAARARRGNLSKRRPGEDSEPGIAEGRSLMKLMDSFTPPDEEDTQLYKLETLVRVSNSSTSSSSGNSGSLPVTPEAPRRCVAAADALPSSLPHRRVTVTSRSVSNPAARSTLFRFAAKDTVPIILPPPVSEVLLSRSPKPPAKSIRFKGAGRQYAALSPPTKAPHRPAGFKKSESVASAMCYEPELINASTIALKQRTSALLDAVNEPNAPRLPPRLATSVGTASRSVNT